MTGAYGDRLGPGSTIGHYMVERVLGSGGMGRVFVAISPTGRRVAVKVMREEYAADPRFQVRFAREVEAARRVSGAYTASVIDAATDGPLLWMATLFVPGPSLADRVRDGGPMPEREARVLAYELAEALRDIHRVGLVHRDLKPGNILLTDDGPRVIDFGIARVEGTDRLTHTDAWVGTPAFMAPEQFLAQAGIGPAADVFSLGGVLTYALSGAGPFGGDSPYAIAWSVVHEEPVRVPGAGPLHELIGQCLAKDPAARPTPTEILELLRESTIQPPAAASETAPQAHQAPARVPERDSAQVRNPEAARVTDPEAERAADEDAPRIPEQEVEQDAVDNPSAASVPEGGEVGDVPPPGSSEAEKPGVADGGRPRRRVALMAGALVVSLALGLVVWQPWGGRQGKEPGAGGPTASEAAPSSTGPVVVAASWTTKVPSGGGHCTSTDKVVLCESEKEAVTAYDARTGKRLWGSPRTRDNSVMLTVAPARSLVIIAEGNDAMGPGGWDQQVLRAVDLTTGRNRWKAATIMGRSAALSGTDLVVGGEFGISGRDVETGTEKWHRTKADHELAAYPLVVAGVIMSLRPGDASERPQAVLESLDPSTGAVRWSRDLPAPDVSWARQAEKSSAGVEVWGTSTPRLKEFLRFDASGAQKASHTIRSPETAAGKADIAVFGPTWKVMRDWTKGRLVATDLADGKARWELPLAAADGDPYLDGKGRVYVLRANGMVICLDGGSGRELWRSEPARASTSIPSVKGMRLTVRADGVVFAHVDSGSLAAFKPPGYTGTSL